MGLYLRDLPDFTLEDLANELHTTDRSWGGVPHEIDVIREGNQLTALNIGGNHLPVTQDGLELLAGFFGAPRSFFTKKLDAETQQLVLRHLLAHDTTQLSIRYGDDGLHEIHRAGQTRIEPRQIADVAIKVLTPQAQVAQWHVDPDGLQIDVIVPEGYDRGIGGDPQVDDITRGGLRFRQDRKNNLAPGVNSFLYRLICTNGMVVPETGLSLDARGSTVDSLLAELEMAAEHAFSQVEQQMEHFYALRNNPIDGDVTGALRQMAQERGLPDRTIMSLLRRVPDQLSAEALGHPPTVFDAVNLITNTANDPAYRQRRGTREQLEIAGGSMVREVVSRCTNCHQAL